MEQIRTLRTILAPLVLIASLLCGAWFDRQLTYCVIKELGPTTLTAIGGLIAVMILPAGFVIGGFSIGLQALCQCVTGRCWPRWDRFELRLTDAAWAQIWDSCGITESRASKNTRLWAASLWLRSRISNEVREIAERRWHSLNAHFNACTAIALSYPIGFWFLGFSKWEMWVSVTVLFFLLFACLAFLTRREASEYIELMARTPSVWGESPKKMH